MLSLIQTATTTTITVGKLFWKQSFFNFISHLHVDEEISFFFFLNMGGGIGSLGGVVPIFGLYVRLMVKFLKDKVQFCTFRPVQAFPFYFIH